MKLRHLAPWIETTGGIETLLAHHARADATAGFEARQISYFDRGSGPGRTGCERLGFSGWWTPRAMRHAMTEASARHGLASVVHHGPWGVPWFADVDGSDRRLIFFHDTVHRFHDLIPALAGLADGVLCSSRSSAQALIAALPGLTPERVATPPYPIEIPSGLAPVRPPRREWVVGHVGRVERGHKAAHRLVPFVRAAREAGLQFRIEVMGDGSLRPELERAFAGDASVAFLGWQFKDAYWRRLATWDAVVCFSDHEGGPIAVLEAMAAGAIPIYPRIGGGLGDDYAPQVDARCYYAAGDPAAAARALAALQALGSGELDELRRRGRNLVLRHHDADYVGEVGQFVRRIAALPRISRPPRGDRIPQWSDRVPLGVLTRFFPAALRR